MYLNQSNYISLHNHTQIGSPLDSIIDVDLLFKKAKEYDMPAVAITDHGTMTAHYDAWKASQKTGVKLIPGIESYFADSLSDKKSYHMVLLAKNETGYKNLLHLNFLSYKNQHSGYMGKKIPRISWEHIEKYNEGIICLTACSSGLIAQTLITQGDTAKALNQIHRLNHIFKNRLRLELQPHKLYSVNKNGGIVSQVNLNEELLKISHDLKIPYVITSDSHYLSPEEAHMHDLMLAIRDKKAFDDPNRFRYGVQDMYLKTKEEIISFFGADVANLGIQNSIDIMNACEEPSYLKPRGPMLPKFDMSDQEDFEIFKDWKQINCPAVEDDKAYLRFKCIEGFKNKCSDFDIKTRREYWERVKLELGVLEEKDFSSYMLIVSDYINWAKKSMPVGPARGCFIAGSQVTLYNGSRKSIEDVSIGELVLSHDGTSQCVINTMIYPVDEELIELEFENGKVITCTKEHEFFTINRGWVSADELTKSDDINHRLCRKRYVWYFGPVYDLTVENTHSYHVEDLAVHNSAAGSMVAFLTDITSIDPIKYGLIFERFHNNQKKSFPDIDTDFSRPGLVKEYIKERYGEDRVASISNWSTLSPKVIIKDIARSLRIGGDKSSAFQISGKITDCMGDEKTIAKERSANPIFDAYMHDHSDLCLYAEKLQNLTRNWSVHAAGMVIGAEPLSKIIPLRIEDRVDHGEALVVTQWEKTRCEDNGLIKMDLLGLKTLTVIDETFKLIKKTDNLDLTVKDIDLDDFKVYDMIGEGSTSGVFQLESSLTPLCMRLKPRDVEDISIINAVGRPSCQPAERRKYIARRLGEQQAEYLHDSTKRALQSTYGVLVYEEQAMFLAQDCAGWDLNQADALRKISKLKGKDPDLVLKTETAFIADCMSYSKMSYDIASQIWEQFILPLGNYAFNKSLLFSTPVRVIRNSEEMILPIQKVRSGDFVYSRNEDNQEDCLIKVKNNHYHNKCFVYKVTLDSGEEVVCTRNHKFRTTTGEMLPLWLIQDQNMEIVVSVEKQPKVKKIMAKITSVEYVGEQDTYDLEVENSDHQYYLANGILTSNSHSISYSHISFYTAWLRCHYPTQFMCALLNSEDPNSDKTQEYLTECVNMGISVLPPSINAKGDYTVVKTGQILTGLGAMKGIGESAIVEIQSFSPYDSIEAFFAKTSGRTVNKRVLQALAKSGAFDEYNIPRKVIFDEYAKYRTKVNLFINKYKKTWILKNKNLFSVGIEDGDKIQNEIDEAADKYIGQNIDSIISQMPKIYDGNCTEWTKKELLVNEQEVLGRTISGSLHEVFSGFFRGEGSLATKFDKILNLRPKSRIRVEAIVKSKVKEFKIKNGKNIGQKFAKYIIEDSAGSTITMTVWADDYSVLKSVLTDGTPIKAICSVNEFMDQKDLALVSLEKAYGKGV